MSQNENEFFMKHLTESLEQDKPFVVSKLFTTDNSEIIQENMNEIMRIVCGYLTVDNKQNKKELFNCCEDILISIATNYNPMETILEFLEQMECVTNYIAFCTILQPLEICMNKVKNKSKMIDWCVNAIRLYITDLPEPSVQNPDDDGNDKDNQDEASYEIHFVYREIILFIESMKQNVSKSQDRTVIGEESLFDYYLLSLVISMHGKPLCYLKENPNDKTTADLTEQLIRISNILTGDVLYFLNVVSNRSRNIICNKNEDTCIFTDDYIFHTLFELDSNISDLAYANYYYHVLTNEIYSIIVPQVYNSYYIFETCMYLTNILLHQREIHLISRGLTLIEHIMKRISHNSINSQALELKVYLRLFELIINVMIFCDDDAERKRALCVFHEYIKIFNMEAKFYVISYLYENSKHSSLLSIVIGILKSSIIECLESTPRNPHFLGSNSEWLLKKICKLSHGSTTDLVEISDEIISSLNLLRFLFIRDKNNETGIWNIRDIIESDYLKPLREGIDLCKAHWNVKMKDLEEQNEKKTTIQNYDELKKTDEQVTLVIGGEQLPIMPVSTKISICHRVINGLDIMKSVLIRVNECMNVAREVV